MTNEHELLTSILSFHKEIKDDLKSINKDISDMHQSSIVNETEIKLLSSKLDTYHTKVETIDKTINGRPENLGKDGLKETALSTKNDLKEHVINTTKEFKHLRSTFALAWTGIITGANVIWSLLTGKLTL